MNRKSLIAVTVILISLVVAVISVQISPTVEAQDFRQICIESAKRAIRTRFDGMTFRVADENGTHTETWFYDGYDRPQEVQTYGLSLDTGQSIRKFYFPPEHPDYKLIRRLKTGQDVYLSYSEECVISVPGWERHDEGYLHLSLAR
jgi:hypothetical protein